MIARVLLGILLVVSMTRGQIERAVGFARWPHTDAERARFHARYMTKYAIPQSLAGPAVQSIEVLTEFRRMELITEQHEQLNDLFARGGAIQEAEDALKPFHGQASVIAHVLFGLLTVTTPDIAVVLTGTAAPPAMSSKMTPVYAGRAIVGGDFEAVFASAAIGQSTYVVSVRWNGSELARATVDFGAID